MEFLRADYTAARASRYRRRRNVPGGGSGADYHYRSEGDYLRVLEYARDMDRNDCIVGQTVDRAVVNAIQQGFTPDPQTGDETLNKDLLARWYGWADDADECDLAGEMCFYDFEQLVYRASLVDGDTFPLPTTAGALQVIEGHRCRTPSGTKKNVVHGVRLDEFRRRVEYWFTRDDVDPTQSVKRVGDVYTVPARDDEGRRQVFHVFNPKRISQTRGVSALAPVFDVLGMFEDINFAKLVQQQTVSAFAVFRQRASDFAGGMPGATGEEETTSLGDSGGNSMTTMGVRPGEIIYGQPGEELKGFSPNVPNAEFFEHVKLILTLIGVNLGLPLALVTLDASQTNFSGWRGAVDQARMGFKRNQKWLIAKFHRPVWRWKVGQWAAEDPALRAAGERIDIYAHRWKEPRWPYIQPLDDAGAQLLRVRNALTSPRRIQAEQGADWDEVADELVADNAAAIRKAKTVAQEINDEFDDGQPVHWRELISLPAPEGLIVNLGANGQSSAETPGDNTGRQA